MESLPQRDTGIERLPIETERDVLDRLRQPVTCRGLAASSSKHFLPFSGAG